MNNQNLLLAVVLSMAVLFGFDFFGTNKTVQKENTITNQTANEK